MECGNMTHSNDGAMAGPGTEPATPMPPADKQVNPHVTPISKPLSVAEHGSGGYVPSPLSWKNTEAQ